LSASANTSSVAACTGFVPDPCATSDLSARAITTPDNWNWKPAYNTIQIDPDFGERILRATDANTFPTCFGSATQNTTIATADNPTDHSWSSDSTKFMVEDTNGNHFLMGFNPATMQVSCLPWASSTNKQLPFYGMFGRTAANAGQLIGASTYVLKSVQTSQYASGSPTYNTIKDLSTCSGLGFLSSAAFNFNKTMGWIPSPSVDVNDQYEFWTAGPMQNEGWLSVLVYNPNGLTSGNATGQTCNWIDLRTGQTGGDTWSGTVSGVTAGWGVGLSPSLPTFTATSGGSLTTGHTINITATLAMVCFPGVSSCTINQAGLGESTPGTTQQVTLSAGATAISVTAPGAYGNTDNQAWSHYNVYACDATVTPGCTPTLQPAANLVAGAVSPPTISVTVTSGSGTNWAYTCVAMTQNYTVWNSQTVSGGSTPNNKITCGSVTAGIRYKVFRGTWGQGGASGTATCDPIADAVNCTASLYGPVEIQDSGSPASSMTDSSAPGLPLSATGTIKASQTSTLTSLTGGGPVPPSYNTLGIPAHAALMDKKGLWVHWGQEPFPGDIYWQLGSSSVIHLNGTAANENPANSYVSAAGHGIMGWDGVIYNGGGPGAVDYNYDNNWRPSNALQTLTANSGPCAITAGFPNVATTCRMITTFPALNPSGASNIDQHQSWGNNAGPNDLLTPFFVSTDPAASNSYQSPSVPGRAWESELYIVNPATGVVYRFGHHRTGGTDYVIANCSVSPHCETEFHHLSLANVSDDMHWAIFTSDMLWHLGCDYGSTCTYNASNQAITGRSRADVFVMELR
jgi:hypothetical protein